MTIADERPAVDQAAAERGAMRAHALNEIEQYAIGFHEGYEAGYADACREMAELWEPVVREIRDWAPRWRPYAERRAAEIERAAPRPGDFTGRLSEAEYFGGDRGAA